MEIVFDTHGNDKQKQACIAWADDNVADVVFGGAKGTGKSYLGCSLIFGDAFMYPDTMYFIARKELNDLRKFTLPSVYEVFSTWGITDKYFRFNGKDNFFQLHNGSKVFFLEGRYIPSDPLFERFGSMQMTRGWIEEAGEFTVAAKNNLSASVGRWKNDVYNLKGKVLQTCNPSKNYLYSDYYKKFRDGTLEEWKRFIQSLPQDNKKLPAGYIEQLERVLDITQKERLLRGNWEFDDDPALLVEYEAICDLFTNDHVSGGERFISTDLAMKGRDRYIAGSWSGNICSVSISMAKSDAKQIEDSLRRLKVEKGVPNSRIVSDADGLGQYLEAYIKGIREFHGGAAPLVDRNYANLKSECAYKLAELINKREIKIICTKQEEELIKEELGVLKAVSINSDTSKKKIISKEQMKLILGRSPDFLDMLIMKMIFNIKPVLKGIKKISYGTT